MSAPAAAVAAAAAAAAWGTFRPATWPVFRVRGHDAVDLLSRLSTNDLSPLAAGRPVTTLFLCPRGRIVARVHLLPLREELLAAAEPPAREAWPAWIDKYTFAEDARVEAAPDVGVLLVAGGRIPADLAAAASGAGAALVERPLGALPGALAVGSPSALEAVAAALAAGGAGGGVALDESGWEQLRIEAGAPAQGRELTLDDLPLEAGLAAEVSFTKGCYVGQEVIARQDSRDKITRRLAALAFAEAPAPDEVLASESRAGCRVTSVAPAPVGGESGEPPWWPALGYVRAENARPGAVVTTAAGRTGRVREPSREPRSPM